MAGSFTGMGNALFAPLKNILGRFFNLFPTGGTTGGISVGTPAGRKIRLYNSSFGNVIEGDNTLAAGDMFVGGLTGTLYLKANNVNAVKILTNMMIASDGLYGFANATGSVFTSSQDTSSGRIAPAVTGFYGATTSTPGWPQNTAGLSRVTADVPNSTATMANTTGLTATLIAGRKNTGQLVLFCDETVPGEGIKIDLDGSVCTATSFVSGFAATPATSGIDVSVYGVTTTTAIATDLTITTVPTTVTCYVIKFEIVVNAGGTFIPRFAQVSHSSGTATIRLGSYMEIQDSPT